MGKLFAFLCINTFLLLPLFIFCQKQSSIDLVKIYKTGKLQAVNRGLNIASNEAGDFIKVSETKGEGIVWLPINSFKNGSLEIVMRGKDVLQRSFIGIVFHGLNDSTYDAVYCRPFNFLSQDSVRRVHAIQYISHPVFTWSKLRNERNAVFEKEIIHPPDPNDWFTMKLIIADGVVKAFINNAEIPSLVVEKLNKRKSGKIGLFTGDTSGGDFKTMRIRFATKSVKKKVL